MTVLVNFRQWLARRWWVCALVLLIGLIVVMARVVEEPASAPSWQEVRAEQQVKQAEQEAREAVSAAQALLQMRPAATLAETGYPKRGFELPLAGHGSAEYIKWVDSTAPGCTCELSVERGWHELGPAPVYKVKLMVGYYTDSMPQGWPCWCTVYVIKVPVFGLSLIHI